MIVTETERKYWEAVAIIAMIVAVCAVVGYFEYQQLNVSAKEAACVLGGGIWGAKDETVQLGNTTADVQVPTCEHP